MGRYGIVVAAAAMLLGATQLTAQASSSSDDYEPQVSEGEVVLEAQPAWSDGRLVVELSANTHSVDLGSLDLYRLVRLVIGERELAPIEAGSLGGHHARTRLVFEVADRPAGFDLVIREVPDVPVRRLSWSASG